MEPKKRLFLKACAFLPLLLYFRKGYAEGLRSDNNLSSNSIHPEDFGAKGNGQDDDSLAMKDCFEYAIKNGKTIFFKNSAVYLWGKKVTVTGTVKVFASNATILSDDNFLEVIDGAGSMWDGGILKSQTTPYTVTYNKSWNIKESGAIGYGRMPFDNEANRVEDVYLNQKIGCVLLFRSSNNKALDGVTIKNVKSIYGNIIIAGFNKIIIDSCKIKGGSHMGGVAIFNGTRDPLLWGYRNRINNYEFSRGAGHRITNSVFYECRNNGLFISGSSDVLIESCKFLDNGESGLKTAQYVKRSWTNSNCCCTNIRIINCTASGQGYDGFDLQNVFGSGESLHLFSDLMVIKCDSSNNRRTGFISQGGGNFFQDCSASRNGSHGLVSKYSQNVKMLRCSVSNNLQEFDGIEIGLLGPDCIMEKCQVNHTEGKGKYFLITHQVVNPQIKRKSGYSIDNIFSDINKCSIDPRVIVIN